MFADLVLEGGGVKGIALVGAISVLEERGYQFRRVAGTSAGAIVGALEAAMLNTMTVFYDRSHIDDAAAAARTIVVDTGTVRVTDFDLDRDTQDLLFRKGREATLKFLDGAPGQPAWDWDGYKRSYRSWQSAA